MKYVPRKEAALLLYEAIKSPDAKRELRLLDMETEVMCDAGLERIFKLLEDDFKEKKVTNITGAIQQYEPLRRHPDEGVKAFAT